MGGELLLPDSRLKDRSQGAFMADWPMPDGATVRIEVAPVYCANCGKMYGYIPRENTTFACWLCQKCFDTYGDTTTVYVEADHEFNKRVEHEMLERFGRALSAVELDLLAEDGRLGRGLELLARESPYPSLDRRPRG